MSRLSPRSIYAVSVYRNVSLVPTRVLPHWSYTGLCISTISGHINGVLSATRACSGRAYATSVLKVTQDLSGPKPDVSRIDTTKNAFNVEYRRTLPGFNTLQSPTVATLYRTAHGIFAKRNISTLKRRVFKMKKHKKKKRKKRLSRMTAIPWRPPIDRKVPYQLPYKVRRVVKERRRRNKGNRTLRVPRQR
ncbi:hypothetical protein BBOV_II001775 [Babesia bovis T2Bo]|uniref:hypothetical protein n=1 Tax=Babesia bovis T2Bo TaxID=484906 RepID=UPI001C34A388|nr:hypothetical protein BBOV_II001775 [Babesia bovis T2Bo]KAG6440167.1 hypothetical protein BBOV_II001775 [Babesia bovis T2Bo]